MNKQQNQGFDFNRRDFLRGGSAATLMTMLGGVQLFGADSAAPAEAKRVAPKVKLGVIGLGPWGRELLTTLGRLDPPEAEVAAICDNYGAMVRRSATLAPNAAQADDYKTILGNKDITAVIIATPTHLHKQIVLDALAAGKHVYCEAPLAASLEDAKAIAAAAKAARHLVFQSGLQLRADPQRHFLLPFIRSGALGQFISARAQWNKKQSWRATSPNADREKALNWRLEKPSSTGLIGELGIHQLDQAIWFLNGKPRSITGFGMIALWKDGREVPDTVQAVLEFPAGVCLNYSATLGNSFDGSYEMFYGTDAAVMLRDTSAWMFKEVDSPLLGWEVYAKKDVFYKETGIVLKAGASKSAPTTEAQAAEEAIKSAPVYNALQRFIRNCSDVTQRAEDLKESLGEADPEELAKVQRRPVAGYEEGYVATVLAIKANESILKGERLELKPDLYELS